MIEAIGVIGGGQLGRMLTLVAKRMGYRVVVLDPQAHSPCGQVADEQIVAAYEDLDAIERLGKSTDIVTYEFENIAIESVEHLERRGYRVTPTSGVLAITQDRVKEKIFVRECGANTTDFAAVRSANGIADAVAVVGIPAILKTARGGYDGKGQWHIASADTARAAVANTNGAALILERAVDFVCELSVIATRASDDAIVTFPVAENVHDGGILVTTIAPARVDDETARRAQAIARTIGSRLHIVGTYCVELFLTRGGELLVNEIAPRPHNSGHFTIDATPCSQYEEHVRAICDLPLSPPRMFSSAVMMNVLGDGTGNHLQGTERLLEDPSIVLHVYGKRHAVARRKMGHVTMLVDGPVDESALARATSARAMLSWG
ncbi:MAG: 5-(carboxyamino)imidazole ribonucleotide synthase [Candidatus Tyrphobacter sp.]